MWLLTAFEDFVDLFKVIENEGIESASVERMLEKVGNLLEQTKHSAPAGGSAAMGGILHIVKRKVMQRVKKKNTLASRLHKQLCSARQRAETIAEKQMAEFMSKATPILELDLTVNDEKNASWTQVDDDHRQSSIMIHLQVAGTGVACQTVEISKDTIPEPIIAVEEETLDALDALLKQEMVDYKAVESEMVVCGACSEPIEGGKAKSVCAIEKYWHSECFTCTHCDVRLIDSKDGQFFTHNNLPYVKCMHKD